ncbi:MAG TPA: DUF2652 domain-containing protein [Anaerolineales bacterium]|nr:DUF2652 domain-containing protein [Anaerolineales bacterium]
MAKTVTGFILIADISGYTMFLSQSELEHAQEILQSLLELLIENTRIPLIISRLEGDAVISYALEGSFLQGATLLELIESCYVAFKRAIELMVINTTCTCNACKNIPTLDLKFFIHHGSFGLQPLPAYTELIGTDVNLIHRLTKNHVKENTGLQAYVLFTQAAMEALGVQELAGGMEALTETYDHIGEVNIFVQDMQPVWERERDRSRIMVKPEDAIYTEEREYPVAPVYLWDYLLKPEFRAIYIESDVTKAENLNRGRIGIGTVYQCAHGNFIHPQTIMDWKPFETHTIMDVAPPGIKFYSTYHLIPTENGTRLKILVGPVQEINPLLRAVANRVLWIMWKTLGKKGRNNLREKMAQDLAEGKTIPPETLEINLGEIRNSIRAALASPGESN